MKKKVKVYLHRSKESNYDTGEEIGLSEKAMDNFKYALSEVEFELEVDTISGKYEIKKVNGKELKS